MVQRICGNCGFTGRPKLKTKGSLLIEIIAWLLFIVPGLVYTLWRHASRERVCPKCEAPNMLPLDSPRGLALGRELGLPPPPLPGAIRRTAPRRPLKKRPPARETGRRGKTATA